jgi:hypothetical protein
MKVGSTNLGQSFFYTMPRNLCNRNGKGCTVLAAQVGLEYTDGKPANPSNGIITLASVTEKVLIKPTGIYIHHILTSDSTKRITNWISNCGNKNARPLNIAGLLGGTAFIGAGEDSAGSGSSEGGAVYTSEDGTRNTGYHIGAQDTFTGWAEIVNYNKSPKQIYVYYDLEWVPGIQGDDVKMVTLTATCGGSPAVRLSKNGPTNTTSGNFYFMEDGNVIGARGHLHGTFSSFPLSLPIQHADWNLLDGGVKVSLFINGKYKCTSDAVYGDKSESDMGGMGGMSHGGEGKGASGIKTISKMTACRGPFPVKKGDSLKLVAEYDLKKHPLRQTSSGKAADVMAMMGISFTKKK